ncbi:MAG: hypothetical protein ACYTKD_25725 [Planctomycetota bacterium]
MRTSRSSIALPVTLALAAPSSAAITMSCSPVSVERRHANGG